MFYRVQPLDNRPYCQLQTGNKAAHIHTLPWSTRFCPGLGANR